MVKERSARETDVKLLHKWKFSFRLNEYFFRSNENIFSSIFDYNLAVISGESIAGCSLFFVVASSISHFMHANNESLNANRRNHKPTQFPIFLHRNYRPVGYLNANKRGFFLDELVCCRCQYCGYEPFSLVNFIDYTNAVIRS